jgi:AcrR family transcriptional regulator
MRKKSDETRRKIMNAAYESFWRAGFARSNVDLIAERAGVTKRTLYAHFRSKDDLLAAVLTQYSELATERLRKIESRMPADVAGTVDSLFSQLSGWAKSTPRWSGTGFTRLVVELADLPGHPARAIARKAKATTEKWLAQRFEHLDVAKPAERARELMTLMEGSVALTLIHGDHAYFAAAARAAKTLLAQTR